MTLPTNAQLQSLEIELENQTNTEWWVSRDASTVWITEVATAWRYEATQLPAADVILRAFSRWRRAQSYPAVDVED